MKQTRQQTTTVEDTALLASYPHLAPPKVELVDVIPSGDRSLSVYRVNPGRPGAGHGLAVRCNVCGTILRTGQPHSSRFPVPHQSLDMLTVVEPEDFEERAEAAADARLEAKRVERASGYPIGYRGRA